jgi:hypothetical protein
MHLFKLILPGDKDSSLHFVTLRNDRRFSGHREGSSGDLIEDFLKERFFQIAAASLPLTL